METANKTYSPGERVKLFRKVEGTRYSLAVIKILKEAGVSSNPGYLRWAFHTKSGDDVIYQALEKHIADRKILSNRSNKRISKTAKSVPV